MRHRLTRNGAAWLVGAGLLLGTGAPAGAEGQTSAPGIFAAGAYTFSDELGGFHILSARGTGTRNDPIVIRQELESSSPVTLVIRANGPIEPYSNARGVANGFLHVRAEVVNNSGQAWIEFEFELQEQLRKASVFGDGLSFDQRRSDSDNIGSDSFADYSRDFEPYDRLLFRNGRVDPRKGASFSFLITDFTPRWQFFLVLDPRIPSS
ncbi:MAG: hypothetical protein ABWZ57_05710 [Mesorhizobium sp.]|jgi:hypothetical protein